MFDPYRKWLGISEANRPPTHYQLLAIEPTERDPDVIRAAVMQRSAYVRNYQAGKHADDATRLLNEIAAADACLGNPSKRAAYDAELKRKEALKKPRPAPARPAAPVNAAPPIDPLWALAASAASAPPPAWLQQPRRRSLPAWQWAALIGGAVVVLLVVVLLIAGLGGDEPTVAQDPTNSAAALPAEAPADSDEEITTDPPERPAEADALASGEPAAVAAAAGTDSDLEEPEVGALAATAESALLNVEPPAAALGVVAERIVLWNTHNGGANDYGTLACRLRLFEGEKEVWRKDDVAIPWSPNRDESVSVTPPPLRFDRLRVDITKPNPPAGGLAEVQVFVDGKNVALRRPTKANASFNAEFAHGNVTDGITTSAIHRSGYWVLPDGVSGMLEIDLAIPRSYHQAGITADRVTLWNTHSGASGNYGTLAGDLLLLLNGGVIWRKDNLAVPWKSDADTKLTVDLPDIRFSAVRFEITKANPPAGGLAEIEVWQDDVNVALRRPVTANQSFSEQFTPAAAVDGVTTSAVYGQGYWLIGTAVTGWIEVELADADPAIAAANGQLGEHLCFATGDWQRGLPWLARGDDERFRELAQAELANPHQDIGTSIVLADAWFDVAEGYASPAREELRARAAWHYTRAIPQLPEFSRKRPRERLDQSLSAATERDYLYFMSEAEVSGTQPGFTLRDSNIVVDGREYPYSLWMHPSENASSRAVFPLERTFRRFVGAVGIVDRTLGQTQTPLTFRVVGDGRPLWKSKALQAAGASEAFDLDVTGVKKLELFVDCPGSHHAAGAAWLNPRLEE